MEPERHGTDDGIWVFVDIIDACFERDYKMSEQILIDRELLWKIGDAFQGVSDNDKTVYTSLDDLNGKGQKAPDGEGKWVTPKQIADAMLPAIKLTLGGEWD